jgi:hypothetical protein
VKERSNPFMSLLDSNRHCAGLPRRSSGAATWRLRLQRGRQALEMKSFMISSIALATRDLPFLVAKFDACCILRWLRPA